MIGQEAADALRDKVEEMRQFGKVPTWFDHMGATERDEVARALEHTDADFAEADAIKITITPSRYSLGEEYQVGPEVGMRLAIPRAGGVSMLRINLRHMLDQVFDLLSGVGR